MKGGRDMDVLEWLGQVKKLDQLIDAKIAERQRLIDMAEDICSKPLDGMPHTFTGVVSRKVENAVVQLVDLERELNKLIDQYVDYKQNVVKVLEQLPDKEYGVLHRFYIRGMTLEDIAEDMGYCTRQISRIKESGLQKLEDVIECHAKK
jgi:hypothetical protein